jgi:transcriptional regulator GlxA family with amidase domain
MRRRVAFVVFPRFQLVDAAGPLSTFEIAGRFATDAYRLEVLAPDGGATPSSSGLLVQAEPLGEGPFDTIVISGGAGLGDRPTMAILLAWLKTHAPTTRRIASVCTGAYVLAEGGFLNGRRATTHWEAGGHFSERYPRVRLEPDRIFVRDGPFWTSAGVTAGIDLALALIEDDLGDEVARRVAQQMIVHQRRPSGQFRLSGLLDTGGVSGRFVRLLGWIREHLADDLSVEVLAEQAAISPRHFARVFRAEIGLTPAKAIEQLRLRAARLEVETSRTPIEEIARATGFGDDERMRRAFVRAFGGPPHAVRQAARSSLVSPGLGNGEAQ